MTVRVRFAPSPTGFLHVGNAIIAIRWNLKAKKVKLYTPSGAIDLSSPMVESNIRT